MKNVVLRSLLLHLLFSGFVWCSLMAVAQPALALSSKQSLQRAMQELASAPAATRAAFVEAAVTELSSAYRAAAEQGGKRGKRAKKTKTWNAGTQAYVASLQRAAAAARAGAPVQLLVDRGRSLRVIVGQRPVRQFIISAPRAKGRLALERAILRRLCAAADCGQKPWPAVSSGPVLTSVGTLPPATPMIAPKPVPPAAARIVTTLPSSDGLRCAQGGVRHQVLYHNACKALLGDVRALIKALHASARNGVLIDWRMPARPYAKGEQYTLAVNGRGDTVSLPMTLLGTAPELLIDILPWAQERLFGRFRVLELRPPERLVYSAAVALR